jgi:tetratricopeptide (TPR) repeat protein
MEPNHAKPYFDRGIARLLKGNLDGAIEDYTEGTRMKPDHAEAYYARGLAFRAKGDPASAMAAIADFQKYLDGGGGLRDRDQAAVEGFIRELKKNL